ncbi:hypothetical protein [Sphingosinicella humi]|uniref:Spore coat protein U domain-containing protein n=1 Tax=Allosphingosinicella humi TaxID=2068657 RepID=A0A2U2J1L7_9SPHN|nr:hypothetical protein [Sphingosinicella humi]PWG02223.1 hypothetical protein DF286_04585 [Sphingosinicella humi]
MKKILIAAVASTALIATPAFAGPTDSQALNVSGTVNQECSIAAPAAVNFPTVNINEGAGANALLLKNGSQAQSQNIYVSCNYAAKVGASSQNGGLLNAAGATLAENDPDDFTNVIHYRVKLDATDNSFPVLDFRTRLEAGDSVNAAGAFHNNALLEVRIDRDDTAKRPVAGAYTDVTVLSAGPV